jgi:Spy/CpxP family protein refolding chaperone
MTIRIPALVALLVATALPLAAQERPAPPGQPPIERLEALRLERLQEALDLTQEQTETLRRQMDQNRTAMRESFDRQQAAIDALHESLKGEPADQEGLRRALAEVEASRADMERLRESHMADLERTLTLEQRAKFLLFNRQFDSRLRELVERHHRGPEEPGRLREPPDAPRAPRMERPEPSREERIEMLEHRIQEMQGELEDLRGGAGD